MRLRFLVIGFGFMGQTHAGNLLKNPRAELVGIVDPCSPFERLTSVRGNKDTVHLTPEDIRNVPHYPLMEKALEESGADAVIIALPTKLHYDAVVRSLEHGYHVLVEKPFSTQMEECTKMCALAKEKKKVLSVGYVVREMKEYQRLRETVRSKRLGKLTFLSMSRITGVPAWGNWRDPEFIKASGGALFDLVSHDLDFARYCLGEPEEILADPVLCREFHGNMVQAVLRYPGWDVKVEGGFVSPPTFPFRRNYTAYFEEGTLLSDAPGDYREITKEGIRTEFFADDNPYYTEVDRFISAVLTGDISGICTGEDACRSIQCCHRIAGQLQ